MPVWIKAALAQVGAVGVVWIINAVDYRWWGGGHVPVDVLPCLIGLAAVLLSLVIRLPNWWLPIQGIFVPGLIVVLSLELPPFLFLTGLIVLILLFPSNLRERVPLYLSNRATWEAVAELCPRDRPFSMLDLGCGTGVGLCYLAGRLPEGRFVGVETAPLLYGVSCTRMLGEGNARVKLKNFWSENLGQYDVVYAFLSPSPMARLWDKVRLEMKPGSLFISNTFAVPGSSPTKEILVNDRRRTRLLIWRIGETHGHVS
jgi:hypothetical protein